MSVSTSSRVRRHLDLKGRIQGVGFRPFVYRLARELQLDGHVLNDATGVQIEIEGPADVVAEFERDLQAQLPPMADIRELISRSLPAKAVSGFEIRSSLDAEPPTAEVTPDAATCDDCLAELADRRDRRHGYAFTNCTNCGPRYSIIRAIPYDRPATTMASFQMCPLCSSEYANPRDRRFHAQPNACPTCGPRLEFRLPNRERVEGNPIILASDMLRRDRIIAVKGIGGFHLACRADVDEVVERLRDRKLRDGKPLAVMVANLEEADRLCRLAPSDREALVSPSAPIVLAKKRERLPISSRVAPNCDTLGLMLPYAPVHHLLFAQGLGPLIMTSANLSGLPLTYGEEDAFEELSTVADGFLIHDREIFRPIDDSVVFTWRGEAVPLRRARGYAPAPLRLQAQSTGSVLAVGGELKSTVCLFQDRQAILSEHLGDLTRPQAYRHFVRSIDRLRELFAFRPDVVAYDLHPAYLSTQYARGLGIQAVPVQHHHAHVVSAMAENGITDPVVGVACDGVGYGTDGAAWGCEVMRCDAASFARFAHLRYFPLAGGDLAALQTWRPAAALLHEAFGDSWRDAAGEFFAHVPTEDLDGIQQVLRSDGLRAPRTSSLGRVFDAVSFLLGLCDRNRHEAEAAMALESAVSDEPAAPYPYYFATAGGSVLEMSLAPAFQELIRERRLGRPVGHVAARFHETVARMLVECAAQAGREFGLNRVALSGGCFANRRLLTRVADLLESRNVDVITHRQVPCGDGGLSLGQAVAASAMLERT